MKSTLLVAALGIALTACSTDSTGPTPSAPPAAARVAEASLSATDKDGIRDALDRVAATLDGADAGRLRGALSQLLNAEAAGRTAALNAVTDALTALEAERGDEVGAELDAIRLALPMR